MEENGSHYLKIDFPPTRIRSIFEKWFPLTSMTVWTSRKEQSSKVDGFHYRENPSSIVEMKHSLKNTFPLDRKTGSSGRNIKNGC